MAYVRGTDFVCLEEADADFKAQSNNYDTEIDGDSPSMTDNFFALNEGGRRINSSRFNAEVERAQKHSIVAREVCLIDWEVRDKSRQFFEKLCLSIKQIISGKHVKCQCKETEAVSCKMLLDLCDQYFKLLRDTNMDFEKSKHVSQTLDDTLVKLEDALTRFKDLSNLDNYTEVDQKACLERIDALEQYYLTLGTHNTSFFYEKNEVYQKLKKRPYRICCVCGIKSAITDESSELKDAVVFKELLVVEDGELKEWKAIKSDDEDELGALAQTCFHIANVEHEKRYYHLLNIDDPDPDNSICLLYTSAAADDTP